MQNYYQFMIPRLNGEEIKKNFSQYRSLVRKGIAGFIIFGGELETVRTYIRKLQEETELPLIISSDLERGLGQQLKGGTVFPPAMAIGAAYKKLSAKSYQQTAVSSQLSAIKLLRRSFKAVAKEAAYAGINTIFAPVLDISTNPKNPIIAVRAFGENPATVSLLGIEMIKALQRNGIAACGKHFPGHGETSVDSHIRLPVLHQDMKRLRRYELKPFAKAIEAGVKMIMLGHLSVPALDESGIPVSFSKKAVQFLRNDMGYDGLLITDALNMGGIGIYSEEEASAMALEAGVDILLHPSDAEKVVAYLERMKPWSDPTRLLNFRKRLRPLSVRSKPPFDLHSIVSEQLTKDAITTTGRVRLKGTPLLVILNDDEDDKGIVFADGLKKQFPEMRMFRLKPGIDCNKEFISIPPSPSPSPSRGEGNNTAPPWLKPLLLVRGGDEGEGVVCGLTDGRLSKSFKKRKDEFMIVAIFSETKAWKGGASSRLFKNISALESQADLFVSFGSPYLLDPIKNVPRMYVYWDSSSAQAAAASMITGTDAKHLS